MSKKPVLTMTYEVWRKLQYMRNNSSVEVSGFGITSMDNPLHVTDFILVEQDSTVATVEMTKKGIREYDKQMINNGYCPAEFMRIWIHTHPKGMGPNPSSVDEKQFAELFSNPEHESHWGIMMILGDKEKCSCRLRLNYPVVGEFEIPTEIVHETGKEEEWKEELEANVNKKNTITVYKTNNFSANKDEWDYYNHRFIHDRHFSNKDVVSNWDEWCEDEDCDKCKYYDYCYGFTNTVEEPEEQDLVDIALHLEEDYERKI